MREVAFCVAFAVNFLVVVYVVTLYKIAGKKENKEQ